MHPVRPTSSSLGSAFESTFKPRREGAERRRVRRGACSHAATVRQSGHYAIQARVSDLTAEGCRIEGVGPFPANGLIWVRLQGLESLPCRAVWSGKGVTGARFDHPLHPAVVTRYLPTQSRMALVVPNEGSARHAPQPTALEDEIALLSRRARIMRNVVDQEPKPILAVKRPSGPNLNGLIKRRGARLVAVPRED